MMSLEQAGAPLPGSVPVRSSWTGVITDRLSRLLRGAARPQTRTLRQVEALHLGPKRTLYLVECDGQRFLLAAGGDNVSAPVPVYASSQAQVQEGTR